MASVRHLWFLGWGAAGLVFAVGGAAWVVRHALDFGVQPTVLINRAKAAGPAAQDQSISDYNVADSALTVWLSAFRRRFAENGQLRASDRTELARLVENTPLGCEKLMTTALAVRRYCKDGNVMATFFVAVVRKGDKELRKYPPGSAGAAAILQAMNHTKNVLWRIPDDSEHTYINTLIVLFNDSIHWIGANDAEMQLDLYQAYNGLAECYMLRGELEAALAASEAIPPQQVITDAEKGSQAYGRSLILIQMSRDFEAVKFLRVAARVGDRQQTAQRILVDELCKLGRGSEAKAEYVDFVHRFHPAAEQSQEYRDKVVVALADEESRRDH